MKEKSTLKDVANNYLTHTIKSGLNFSHKDIESFASPLEAITLKPLVFNVSEIISLNILWSSITIILYKTETS